MKKRLARKLEAVFAAYAIAERDVISVLEGSHAHLGLAQALGPLAHGARLRDKYEGRDGAS